MVPELVVSETLMVHIIVICLKLRLYICMMDKLDLFGVVIVVLLLAIVN